MKKRGRYQKVKPSGGGWKKALSVVLCVVLVFGALLAGGYYYLDSKLHLITQAGYEDRGTTTELDQMAAGGQNIESIPETEEPSEQATEETVEATEATVMETEPPTTEATEATEPDWGQSGKIVNIMVVGQDYRADEGHKLADTILLMTLNKEKKTLTATSFLRDSYVNLPDYYRGHTCGWNRINTAYALGFGWFGDAGAMDMLNVTIKNNYGVEVDGNIEIGLDSFEKIVDVLGGVDICLEGDELDYMNGVVETYQYAFGDLFEVHPFEEGDNHLNGMEALWYARMRHANGADSDIKRAARQRIIIEKVLGKCKSMSLFQLNNLLDEVLPMIITNISTDDMKMYIAELLPYVFDIELVSNQCPADGTYWGEYVELPDGLSSVLKIDFNQNMKLMKAICEDE